MRTFTQQELNNFILNHIMETCKNYKEATTLNHLNNKNYYFAKMMAYDDMAIVFADAYTYSKTAKLIRETINDIEG